MSTKRKATAAADQSVPVYSKDQLVNSKTLGLPRDAVKAILKDDQQYTKEQATELVTAFLERKV